MVLARDDAAVLLPLVLVVVPATLPIVPSVILFSSVLITGVASLITAAATTGVIRTNDDIAVTFTSGVTIIIGCTIADVGASNTDGAAATRVPTAINGDNGTRADDDGDNKALPPLVCVRNESCVDTDSNDGENEPFGDGDAAILIPPLPLLLPPPLAANGVGDAEGGNVDRPLNDENVLIDDSNTRGVIDGDEVVTLRLRFGGATGDAIGDDGAR